MEIRITSIQIGKPITLGTAGAADPFDREWQSGIFKKPIGGQVVAKRLGLDGDGQADLVHHGGEDKAINVYPCEHFDFWRTEGGMSDLAPGGFGENFTTEGAVEAEVCIGDIWSAPGGALFQISQPRQPCWKLARRWRIKDLAAQVERTGKTGWYLRVLREGEVEPGISLTLVERPHPEWTIDLANEIMHRRKADFPAAHAIAACAALSASWKTTLSKRGQIQHVEDSTGRHSGPQ